MEPLIKELKEGKEESVNNVKQLQKDFDASIIRIRVSFNFDA